MVAPELSNMKRQANSVGVHAQLLAQSQQRHDQWMQ